MKNHRENSPTLLHINDEHSVEALLGAPQGILRRQKAEQFYQLTRHFPCAKLQPWIEVFWIVHWDLEGKPPHLQENIPHPCIHMVLERGHSRVYGLTKGRFTRLLEGKGCIFGVKFKPGGLHAFFPKPASFIVDQLLTIEEVFGKSAVHLEAQLSALEEGQEKGLIQEVQDFLLSCQPTLDANIQKVQHIISLISQNPDWTKVDEIVSRSNVSKRSLQRLFQEYVGASPKWVLQVYRFQAALARLEEKEEVDWADLALELGYFDQSHFIRDFKNIIGQSPQVYHHSSTSSDP